MSTFERTTIGKRLKEALDTQDEPEILTIRRELIAMYGDDSIDSENIAAAITMARNAKHWETIVALAETMLAHDESVPVRIRRIYAQALIELGALTGAEGVLNGLLVETEEADPEQERAEVNGLLGRVSKQRYINFNRNEQLRSAIAAYARAAEDPEKKPWAYSNLIGLLKRAADDGINAGPNAPRLADVRDDLTAHVAGVNPQARDVWHRTMDIELKLLNNEVEEATVEAKTLAEAQSANPFELSSFSRQLAEVWRLPEEHPLRTALSGSNLTLGAGSVAEMPQAEALEKILGDERAVRMEIYERGINAGRQVCMITDSYGNPIGTGFAIPGSSLDDRLDDDPVVVTNAHVIPGNEAGTQFQARFSRMLTADRKPVIIGELDVIWSSPVSELDVTVLRAPSDVLPVLDGIEVSPKRPNPDEVDPYVYIIGHPMGRALEMSIRGNELLANDGIKLQYRAPTEPGNSGSPVFDKNWALVGVHHAGSFNMPSRTDPTKRHPANQGTYIEAVRTAIKEAAL